MCQTIFYDILDQDKIRKDIKNICRWPLFIRTNCHKAPEETKAFPRDTLGDLEKFLATQGATEERWIAAGLKSTALMKEG